MKIAVTYDNGMVFQHFGHTEFFKIYEIEDKEIIDSKVIPTLGAGHGALSGFLASENVSVLICGGIGGGAQSALNGAGIIFYGGVTGSCDEAVKAYLNGTLNFNPFVKCTHHGDDHTCDSHDCGSHN